jgi:hypothetical protein
MARSGGLRRWSALGERPGTADVYGPIEASSVVASAAFRGAIRSGHVRPRAFRRKPLSLGPTNAQVHDTVPDTSPALQAAEARRRQVGQRRGAGRRRGRLVLQRNGVGERGPKRLACGDGRPGSVLEPIPARFGWG